MEPQPAAAAPGVLARLSSHLDWYWTLSPPGRAAFWATFGGWALDAHNQMNPGLRTTAFALSTTPCRASAGSGATAHLGHHAPEQTWGGLVVDRDRLLVLHRTGGFILS